MAMNFKIYKDKELLSIYSADVLRKQVHNNPTSIMAVELDEDLDWTYEKFVGEAKQHPADFSQIYLVGVGNEGNADIFKKLDIPDNQLRTEGTPETLKDVLGSKKQVNLAFLTIGADGKIGYADSDSNDNLFDARELILIATGKDKAKAVRELYNAEENDKEAFGRVKQHRMVTVVLDNEAAAELDQDIVDYYTSEFA
ncbi:6-phosphogluconolactonase [Salinicoccus sp. HZC-1]|uniref:6-phosphogluconolactonase n=1 Tax=Salinicoccus sp. HZC-1 TaxID=3385497 RepID=UPI00398AC76C